jgi:hypothetical protein
MLTLISLFASVTQVTVPDSGATGYLLGIALLAVGLVARFVKNRK